MLVKITLLSFLIFGVVYPLCFLLTARDPIGHFFHRFHLACPVLIGGLAVIGLWFVAIDPMVRVVGALWLLLGLAVCALYWQRSQVNVLVVSSMSLAGLGLYALVHAALAPETGFWGIVVSIYAGLILAALFYAMNLGHFYLNVHGLKIDHLRHAVLAYGVLAAGRLIWDVLMIAQGRMIYGGEETWLRYFISTTDGFLLWVAVFFGTIGPLGGLYFALGTLKLKNTQATTGILYALLSAALLGDLAYKYYLFRFGILL